MKDKGIFLNHVSFQYGAAPKELNDITAFVAAGSFCAITGTNGSGKTTLTYLLNGLIPHQIDGKLSGNVLIDGVNTKDKSVSYFSRKVGLVFQNPDFMIFNLTLREEIAFGLSNLGFDHIDERIASALADVGLMGYERRDPHTLSMGQKQKLCIASVLAMETPYIVLDEPTAMLDYKNTLHLYQLLTSLHRKGKTIIIVEHDTDFLFTYASHILLLDKGALVIEGKPEKVFSQRQKLRQMGIKIPKKIIL